MKLSLGLCYELVRSAFVGILGTIANLLTLYFLVHFLGWYYIIGATLAYLINFFVLFLGDKYYTFRNTSDEVMSQFSRYVRVYMARTFFKILALYVMVEFTNTNYLVAQFIATNVIGTLAYAMVKFWVFNEKQPLKRSVAGRRAL